MKCGFYQFLSILMAIFIIWGITCHRKEKRALEREIANLEYVIRTGEHCVNTCVEIFTQAGC